METSLVDPVARASGVFEPTSGANELGRDEFLRLLVAKLENQDPLSPSQDTEFVAQLATFSSLEQLIDVNRKLESLSLGQGQLVNAQALTLIGKDALVESGDQLRIKNGRPDTIVYALPRPASQASLSIVDAAGVTVRTLPLETTPNGRLTLDWDGTGADGQPLPDGDYSIRVNATDLEGEPLPLAVFRSLPIDGVSFLDGEIALVSGDVIVPFDRILEIRAGHS